MLTALKRSAADDTVQRLIDSTNYSESNELANPCFPLTVSRTFNSLFKVLFIFPSRYLFAIGLVPYLALDGVYHPFWAAFPNNPTLWKRIVWLMRAVSRGSHPLWRSVPSNLDRTLTENASRDYNSVYEAHRFQIWALPASLAVTRGILVSFFSSAYWYA